MDKRQKETRLLVEALENQLVFKKEISYSALRLFMLRSYGVKELTLTRLLRPYIENSLISISEDVVKASTKFREIRNYEKDLVMGRVR